MPTLTVTNWVRWQSYRSDRGQPPWIKVHRTVLRNPEWTMLTDAQRGQLVQLWILAADKGGVIEVPESVDMLTFIQRVCCMESEPSLEALESLGFISLDAKATSTRRQGDVTLASQSRVVQSSTEAEKSSRAREVCKNCGNSWPAEYGPECHTCKRSPKTPAAAPTYDTPQPCTCGDAYRNSYNGKCLVCEGTPSAAQREELTKSMQSTT